VVIDVLVRRRIRRRDRHLGHAGNEEERAPALRDTTLLRGREEPVLAELRETSHPGVLERSARVLGRLAGIHDSRRAQMMIDVLPRVARERLTLLEAEAGPEREVGAPDLDREVDEVL